MEPLNLTLEQEIQCLACYGDAWPRIKATLIKMEQTVNRLKSLSKEIDYGSDIHRTNQSE